MYIYIYIYRYSDSKRDNIGGGSNFYQNRGNTRKALNMSKVTCNGMRGHMHTRARPLPLQFAWFVYYAPRWICDVKDRDYFVIAKG